MSIKIIVATHKKAKMPVCKSYMPVQVGAALKPNLGYVKDNTGEIYQIRIRLIVN